MYNTKRIESIVKDWVKLKTGLELSDETIRQMVTDITETKKCDIQFFATRLYVGCDITKISKKHRSGTIRAKSDFENGYWIVEWDSGNWSREYGRDLKVC
jgi:hypothetical protein